MRFTIPPGCAAPNRRPTVVEAEPGEGDLAGTIGGTRHGLDPHEARALARALIAGALVADPRFDLACLDFDEQAGSS